MRVSLIQELFQSLSALQRSLISAFVGFFFYGSWGIFVNWSHGLMLAVKAGFVQGSYSFILTLCMTMLLEGIFRVNSKIFNKENFINWSTIIISCTAVFSVSWGVNAAAGTPEILRTVILGYIIGGIYSISYVYGLARSEEY